MARTKGASDIKGWREHSLIRDIAGGDLSDKQMAEKYDIALQTVSFVRNTRQPQIAAVLADWSNEFSDLWSVPKHNRIADLQNLLDETQARIDELLEEQERATETLRRIDPTAGKVRIPTHEWNRLVRLKADLHDQIENSMGQRPQHIGQMMHGLGALTRLQQLQVKPGGKAMDDAKMVREAGAKAGSVAAARAEHQAREAERERVEAEQRRQAEEAEREELRGAVDDAATQFIDELGGRLSVGFDLVQAFLKGEPGWFIDAVIDCVEQRGVTVTEPESAPEPEPASEPEPVPEPEPVAVEAEPEPAAAPFVPLAWMLEPVPVGPRSSSEGLLG